MVLSWFCPFPISKNLTPLHFIIIASQIPFLTWIADSSSINQVIFGPIQLLLVFQEVSNIYFRLFFLKTVGWLIGFSTNISTFLLSIAFKSLNKYNQGLQGMTHPTIFWIPWSFPKLFNTFVTPPRRKKSTLLSQHHRNYMANVLGYFFLIMVGDGYQESWEFIVVSPYTNFFCQFYSQR